MINLLCIFEWVEDLFLEFRENLNKLKMLKQHEITYQSPELK